MASNRHMYPSNIADSANAINVFTGLQQEPKGDPNSEPRVSFPALRMRGESATKHPERFLSESFVNSLQDPNPQRKTTRMASRLSPKMWCLLAHALGITRDKPLSRAAKISSTTMRCLTLVTALVFGVSGLVVNVYEAMSEVTNITVLISVFKSAVGVTWILLGIYSHYLAVRSFSSRGLLDYIRSHSKTFMKVRSNVLTCFLCLVLMALNIYSNAYLVDDRGDAGDNNKSTKPLEANTNSYIYYTCSHVELSVELCLLYFFSKVAFSCLALLWVLVVAAVCFSVCRTHTIAIRSFMKELSYDAKIFEEFSILRIQQKNALPTANVTDEIHEYEGSYDADVPRTGEAEQGSIRRKVWRGLRELRHSGKIASFKKSKTTERQVNSCNGRLQKELNTGGEIPSQEHQANHQHLKPNVILETTVNVEDEEKVKACGAGEATHVGSSTGGGNDCDVTLPDLETMTAPIMSNEDVMLAYYKIVKHITITSVLLQRWLTSSFVFSIMWCLLMVTYWTSHHVEMVDVIQFLLPLAVLALIISAYAEVNMESQQLTKYILPTENRMIVLYYVNSQQPQLKVYGAVVSFKILATFITGIALTFATKIILNTI